MSSNPGNQEYPTSFRQTNFTGIFIGVDVAIVVVGIISTILKAMLKKVESETGQDGHGKQDDVELGRTLTHIVPQKARNQKTRIRQIDHTQDDLMLRNFLRHIAPHEARNQEPKTRQDSYSTQEADVWGRLLRDIAAHEDRSQNPTATTVDEEETKLEKETVELFIDYMMKEKPIQFSSQELAVLTWNYCTKLGSGGFGEVYKGEFPNGVKLAVKVLKSSNIDKRVDEQFMAEVGTLGRTYHRNLVRLYGFCFDANNKALVYEYMENGSLDMTLFGKKQELDWAKLWEIAIGVAKGLEYLHHYGHKRIIHYDIKPGNVLLDSEFCPKLADFGLAKLCNRESTHMTLSGGRVTPGYAAPELWMPFPVTYKCDVYSFGMMLFEIVGRRRNLDINKSDSQEWFPRQIWDKYDKGELEMVLADGGIKVKDMVKAKTMAMVALWCVQYSPQARPSMSNVVKILEGEAQVPIPPNPFQHLNTRDKKIPSFTESSSMTDEGTVGEERLYANHEEVRIKYTAATC
ncbi:rust resistance kinase Lr10-like [Tripterygium wilfordii]|uniref:rust resistance kinase Lr10-like n=1 Tax=Tripterygium wilfordii TaxID=458696 RepID=UPI0018F80322|nr:rust resistance kinase Lr10-like [Tripterygium wilfordii]